MSLTVVNSGELVGPCRIHVGQLDGEVVHYLVAHRTVDEHVEVEVLVTEGVVPSEGVFGHRRTNVRAVVLVNHTVAV